MVDRLPDICLADQDIWRTMSPLICFETVRGGKIGPTQWAGPTRWASPTRPELGPGWAIKLLARKKPGQIWPDPVWPSQARPARIFFLPLKDYLARPSRFLGQAGLLKFWPKKIGPILAWPDFGSAHYWPCPAQPGPPDCQL